MLIRWLGKLHPPATHFPIALLTALSVGCGLLPQQAGQPINAMCPVKPKQKAKASMTLTYEGQVIGFC